MKDKKPRIFFISQETEVDTNAPLGLTYLAGYIREKIKGVEVRILDQISKKNMIKIIKKEKPDFIGFSSMSASYYRMKKLAYEVKQISPNSYLVIGGGHITCLPESFDNSVFDIGVIGEGEITFQEVLNIYLKDKENFYNNLRKIKGLLIRYEKVVFTGQRELIKDLSILSIPARDLLNMSYYTLPRLFEGFKRKADIITSRGCPYNCTYCCSHAIWRRKVRYIPEERVIEDIKNLYKNYNVDYIVIQDDIFCMDKERIKRIIELLKKENLLGKIEFDVLARANSIDENIAILFKQLNVKIIRFGFETGSSKILKILKKGTVSIEDGIRACNICKKYGFQIIGYFMAGNPEETEEDLILTYNFMKDNLRKEDIKTLFKTIPLPNTEIWNDAIKKGIIKKDYFETRRGRQTEANFDLMLSDKISREKFKELYLKIESITNQPKEKINYLKLLKFLFNPYFVFIKLRHFKVIFKIKLNKILGRGILEGLN